MKVFFYKVLTRIDQKFGKWKYPRLRFAKYLETGEKFGTNVSNKMLLNAAKYQGYSFYCFWVIIGKPAGV